MSGSHQAFAEFEGRKYLSLETFRRSGIGVQTPVWFASATSGNQPPTLYVYSLTDSGKAKRIRRSGAVNIAPCDARGRLTGTWTRAQARLVEAEEYKTGMALIDRKYWPMKQLLDFSVLLFRRHQRVVIAIQPA